MKLSKSIGIFAKRNAPMILTILGAVGVVATAIVSSKASKKVAERIEEEEEEKGSELTKVEKVKVAAPVVAPVVVVASGTIMCIVGANILNKRRQASLISAYTLLDEGFRNYRRKCIELYGDEADKNIRDKLAMEEYERKSKRDEELFFDEYSHRYFENLTMADFKTAEYELNRIIRQYGSATLNEWYSLLGQKSVKGGDAIGWKASELYELYWVNWIDFKFYDTEMEDGMECKLIETIYPPYPLEFDYFSRR